MHPTPFCLFTLSYSCLHIVITFYYLQVEFLPAAALSAEELERQRLAAEAAAKSTR